MKLNTLSSIDQDFFCLVLLTIWSSLSNHNTASLSQPVHGWSPTILFLLQLPGFPSGSFNQSGGGKCICACVCGGEVWTHTHLEEILAIAGDLFFNKNPESSIRGMKVCVWEREKRLSMRLCNSFLICVCFQHHFMQPLVCVCVWCVYTCYNTTSSNNTYDRQLNSCKPHVWCTVEEDLLRSKTSKTTVKSSFCIKIKASTFSWLIH